MLGPIQKAPDFVCALSFPVYITEIQLSSSGEFTVKALNRNTGVRSGITTTMATTTRSAAKQQEMEQQLASIISMIEEQKASQVEQTQQLLETSRHHSEQLTKLADENQARWESLKARQEGTSEAVSSLEENLSSVKTVMQDRLVKAEEELGQLRSWQEQLIEKQGEFQTGIHEEFSRIKLTMKEMMAKSVGEPESVESKSSLSISAPVFVPSAGSSTTASGGEFGPGSKTMQRPAPYDGSSVWEAYRTQFGLLAGLNKWTDQEKAAYLAISLRGSALTVLTNLPEEQRSDYAALCAALENRFGNTRQVELNRARLRSRMKRREESLPELAEDVERLTRLAYPDAVEQMITVLAKDQFIDSLPEEDMRLRIRQSRPANLRQALEIALELESYIVASRRVKPVREVLLEGNSPGQEDAECSEVEMLCQLERCVKALQYRSRTQKERRGGVNTQSPRTGATRRRGVCWKCGEPGHIQRNCTKSADVAVAGAEGNASPADRQDQGNDQ